MVNQQLDCVKYTQGAYITIEGEPDIGSFYIIQQGKVRISKEMVNKREEVEILGIGDFIGAVSAMSCQSQIETAQALADTVLIKVQRNQYIQVIQNNASLAMKMLMAFSRRLRYLNHMLASLTLYDTSIDGPAHLYNVGEFHLKNKQYEHAVYAYNKYLSFCPKGDKVEIVKEKLAKLTGLAKEKEYYFKSTDINRNYRKNDIIFADGYGSGFIITNDGYAVTSYHVVDNIKSFTVRLRIPDRPGGMDSWHDASVIAVNIDGDELIEEINYCTPIKYVWQEFIDWKAMVHTPLLAAENVPINCNEV